MESHKMGRWFRCVYRMLHGIDSKQKSEEMKKAIEKELIDPTIELLKDWLNSRGEVEELRVRWKVVEEVQRGIKRTTFHVNKEVDFEEMKTIARGIEPVTAGWVREVVNQMGNNYPEVMVRYHFNDVQRKVFGARGTSDVEVDVISFDPLIIAETTIYLDKTKLGKVRNFVKKLQFIEEYEKKKIRKAYFVAFEVHPDIIDVVQQILNGAHVTFIAGYTKVVK